MAEEEFVEEESIEPVIDETPDVVDSGPSIEELQAQIDQLTARAQLVDQFEANPEGVLRSVAGRLGMELVPSGNGNSNGATNGTQSSDGPPQSFIETVSQNLPPEMQFMGESLARASWIANQESLRPFQQQQVQEREEARNAERDRAAAEMDAKHPEWRRSLAEMEELYSFMKTATNGGAMSHPKFGSLQEKLFELVTAGKTASTTAASRMRDAARNGTSTSSSQGSSGPDISELIGKQTTREDKFKVALKAALGEHGVASL